MDYGRPLEFGISVIPTADGLKAVRDLVRAADKSGLELVGLQDHPYQRRFLDTWTLIATLLAETDRVRIFPDVANLPLRHPAMMAKEAASLDVISGGRFELGLGAGGFWDAIEAMGGPRRSSGEAVEALEEAISIIRQAWSGVRSVRLDGKHYRVHGYHPGPEPAHDIEIWLGAYKPRMLGLTGRLADGWLPSLGRIPPGELAGMQGIIDDAAREAGRDPAAVRRLLNISGVIGDVAVEDDNRTGSLSGGLSGGVHDWVNNVSDLATDTGFDTFIFWPSVPDVRQVEVWSNEVAPGVRAEIERRRQRPEPNHSRSSIA
jgi:alkanesulfonate monooxygenase SsuD/methylene tetrahydromethanopterin reductase-like flavin-dependent oxidoreductase (luciferase family)